MTNGKRSAADEFRLMMKWITVAAVLMVIAALTYISMMGDLSVHIVIATILGVFFSVLLGCGLFALAYFSEKSGHYDNVNDSTKTQRENKG
jgi:protein-S-isoprenylcysteine O-methyltransferase Ste14